MTGRPTASEQATGGFTLVEVMIALAILAGGLVVMLRATAGSVFATVRAEQRSVATELARGKMYDLEEELKIQGFQETDQEEDGDFSDEGWPNIKWKAEIVKIELPDMSTLQQVPGQGGQDGAGGQAGTGDKGAAGAAGGGMMGGGGMGAGAGAGGSNSMGGMLMGAYYQMISDTLEASIRKVVLTVTYPMTSSTESIVVACYFTDPAAVDRKIPLASGAGGGSQDNGTDGKGGKTGKQPGGKTGKTGSQQSGQKTGGFGTGGPQRGATR